MNVQDLQFEDLIEYAKYKVISKSTRGKISTERKWLSAFLDSYEDKSYRVELWVLEGSPPQGYVIANHATKRVRAYWLSDEFIDSWSWYDILYERERSYEKYIRLSSELEYIREKVNKK